ncbi:MAG: NifU family protein [Bacteroidota bacterium]
MSDYNREDWISKVDKALDSVRPHLAIDGGNVEVVDVTEDLTVKVKWLGSCVGCSMSHMTMKAGLEQTLKTTVPEVKAVEAVN